MHILRVLSVLFTSLGFSTVSWGMVGGCYSGISSVNNCIFDEQLEIYYMQLFQGNNHIFNEGILVQGNLHPTLWVVSGTENYVFGNLESEHSLQIYGSNSSAYIDGSNHVFNGSIRVVEGSFLDLGGSNHVLNNHNYTSVTVSSGAEAIISGTGHTFNSIYANNGTITIRGENHSSGQLGLPTLSLNLYNNSSAYINGSNHVFNGSIRVVEGSFLDLGGSNHVLNNHDYTSVIVSSGAEAIISGTGHTFNSIEAHSGKIILEGDNYNFTKPLRSITLRESNAVIYMKGNNYMFKGTFLIQGGGSLYISGSNYLLNDELISFFIHRKGSVEIKGKEHQFSAIIASNGLVTIESENSLFNAGMSISAGTLDIKGTGNQFTNTFIGNQDMETVLTLNNTNASISGSNNEFNGKIVSYNSSLNIGGEAHKFYGTLVSNHNSYILIDGADHTFNPVDRNALTINKDSIIELKGSTPYIFNGHTSLDQGTLKVSGYGHYISVISAHDAHLGITGNMNHIGKSTYQLKIRAVEIANNVDLQYDFDLLDLDFNEEVNVKILKIESGEVVTDDLLSYQLLLNGSPLSNDHSSTLEFNLDNSGSGQTLEATITKKNDLKNVVHRSSQVEYISNIADRIIAQEIQGTDKLYDIYNAMLYNQLITNNTPKAGIVAGVDPSQSILPVSSEVYAIDVHNSSQYISESMFDISIKEGIASYIKPGILYSTLRSKQDVQGNNGYKGILQGGMLWGLGMHKLVVTGNIGAGNIKSNQDIGLGSYEVKNLMLSTTAGWQMSYDDFILKTYIGYSYNKYESERYVALLDIDIPLNNASVISEGKHIVNGIPLGLELDTTIIKSDQVQMRQSLYYKGTVLIFEDYKEEGSSGDLSIDALDTLIISDIGTKVQITTELEVTEIKAIPSMIIGVGYRYYDAKNTLYNLIDVTEEKLELQSYNYKGLYMNLGTGLHITTENQFSFGVSYSSSILFKGSVNHAMHILAGYHF